MKNIQIKLAKKPFAMFAVLGFVVSYITFEVLTRLVPIFAVLYDKPNLGYHELPPYVHFIEWTFHWLIWITLLVIIAIDLSKRDFSRTLGYITGVILAGILTVSVIMYRFGEAMEGF